MGRLRAGLLCGLLTCAAAVGAAPAPAVPCDTCLPGVLNFGQVDGILWRGAQPSAEGFRALKAAGARTVVNLRSDHDDAPLLKGTGLRYFRLPSHAWKVDEAKLALFLKIVQDPANQPVFVHCMEGRDRTGYAVAAYRMAAQGWPVDAALREMDTFHFNHVWVFNPGQLRRLDIPRLKARVAALPEPVTVPVP
nr:tyrosine-protein phosphatase [uncultured Holophaga sp.]